MHAHLKRETHMHRDIYRWLITLLEEGDAVVATHRYIGTSEQAHRWASRLVKADPQ